MAEEVYAAGVGGKPAADATPLERSKKLRVPRWDEGAGIQAKSRAQLADELSTYVLESAFVRGELAELRMNASRALEEARGRWATMEGYEVGAGKLSTQADHDRAKAAADPETARVLRQAKWVIDECALEMDRLDKDAIRCQHVYGAIAG